MGGDRHQGALIVTIDDIRFVRPSGYTGEGRSGGLARGLLVYHDGTNLAGEGMGIGGVALKVGDGTCFSRSWTDCDQEGVFRRTFSLDTMLVWGIGGRPSYLLSRLIESCVRAYTHYSWLQGNYFGLLLRLRAMLGIRPLFIPIPSLGTITIAYRVNGRQVEVHVSGTLQAGPDDRFCILNELSADWLTAGWDGEHLVPPPPGWREISPGQLPVSLADPGHGIRLFIDGPSTDPPAPYRIYEGRENTGDLSWAGFCIELGPLDRQGGFPELRYIAGIEPGPLA